MSGGVLCPSGLGLAGRGWRVDACWARGGLTVVGGSGAGGEGGRNVEIRGTAAQCSWSCRSDGVEFYMYQPLGSTHLGCLAGWSLQIAPSATSVRQRSSVRSCRGAALGRLAPRGLKDAVVPLGGGPSVSRFWSSTWDCLITSLPAQVQQAAWLCTHRYYRLTCLVFGQQRCMV